jgi:hypothetical protein
MFGHHDGMVAGGNSGMNWGKPGFIEASASGLVERLKLALSKDVGAHSADS